MHSEMAMAASLGHGVPERTVRLLIPVKIGAVAYKSLLLRRLPTITAFVDDRGSSLDTAITGLALSAGVPQDVIERLGPRDYTAACLAMISLHPELDSNG